MTLLSLAADAYQKLKFGPTPNLIGDRDVEYSFIAANLPDKPGRVLDFGSGGTPLTLIGELKGNIVTDIDLIKYNSAFEIKAKLIQEDILKTTKLKNNYFDTIINCSSIEHVGLSGRYGITENTTDGDLQAMSKLNDILKKNGTMLLTIPLGKDKVITGMHRIYGNNRLPQLIKSYEVVKSIFWIKNSENKWFETTRKAALKIEGSDKYYGIGCFVLKK